LLSDNRDNGEFHHYSHFDFFNRSWNLKGAPCLWSSVHQHLKGENTWKLKALWENPTGFRLLLPAQTYNISSNLPFSVSVACFTLWLRTECHWEGEEGSLPPVAYSTDKMFAFFQNASTALFCFSFLVPSSLSALISDSLNWCVLLYAFLLTNSVFSITSRFASVMFLLKSLSYLVQAFDKENNNSLLLLTRCDQKPQCYLQGKAQSHLKICGAYKLPLFLLKLTSVFRCEEKQTHFVVIWILCIFPARAVIARRKSLTHLSHPFC